MNNDASQLYYENFAIMYMLLLLCPNITNENIVSKTTPRRPQLEALFSTVVTVPCNH